MTQEEAINKVRFVVSGGEDMCEMIISNGPLKEVYLKNISEIWDDLIDWAKGKDLKNYYRNQKSEILNALNGNETETENVIINPKNELRNKLIKFMKKNWPIENLSMGDSYEAITDRMLDEI